MKTRPPGLFRTLLLAFFVGLAECFWFQQRVRPTTPCRLPRRLSGGLSMSTTQRRSGSKPPVSSTGGAKSPVSAPDAEIPSTQSVIRPVGPVPEVLAPAGGREQFLAALNSGADAVFLGLKEFNARARAENFGLEDMQELVPLAHHYGMQVLVTVNVLIKESELGMLVEMLAALEALEVDAIIVQDQGVGAIVRSCFPRLRLHASTQMAVHNAAGVVKAAELGYRRVVLARELTAKELADIRGVVPPEVTTLEAFCHGSLCYSYSGLCFFSGANDARSGNRGECAYTCRQPYQITSEKGYGFLFSMMDLDTSHDLESLVSAGVHTLKIEGRKKDAQFVSSSVQLYRQRLNELYGTDTLRPSAPQTARNLLSSRRLVAPQEEEAGSLEASIREDLSLSFSRGNTTFFLRGRYHEKDVIDLDNAGHLGRLAGQVQAVSVDGRWVRLLTETPLSLYDGIKVAPPISAFYSTPQAQAHRSPSSSSSSSSSSSYEQEHDDVASQSTLHNKYRNALPEFSIRHMRLAPPHTNRRSNSNTPSPSSGGARSNSNSYSGGVKLGAGSRAFEVEGGTVVDLEVPKDLMYRLQAQERQIRQGDLVYKTRSNDLKQRTQALSIVPSEYKLRPWRVVDVSVCLAIEEKEGGEKEVRVRVGVSKLGLPVVEESVCLPLEYAQRADYDLTSELASVFGVFGDAGIRASRLDITGLSEIGEGEGERKVYVGRKVLKGLKAALAATLPQALQRVLNGRRDAAMQALGLGMYREAGERERGLRPAQWEERRFAIKVDRLEALETIRAFMEQEGVKEKGLVREVVFEPKRAFLASGTSVKEGVAQLLAFEEDTGVPVRLAFPTVIRAWDEAPIKAWFTALREARKGGVMRVEVGNLGAMGLLEEWGVEGEGEGVDVASDFTLYALNSQAAAQWARMGVKTVGLSIEDDADNLRQQLRRWDTKTWAGKPEGQQEETGAGAGEQEETGAGSGEGAGAGSGKKKQGEGEQGRGRRQEEEKGGCVPQAILYYDSPLFMAEACSLTALHGGCPGNKVCGYRTLEIENEDGEQFSVAHEQCKSVVYGKRAYSIAHKQASLLAMGVRDFKVNFLTRPYTPQAMMGILRATVLRDAKDVRPIPETHTANFDRQLL